MYTLSEDTKQHKQPDLNCQAHVAQKKLHLELLGPHGLKVCIQSEQMYSIFLRGIFFFSDLFLCAHVPYSNEMFNCFDFSNVVCCSDLNYNRWMQCRGSAVKMNLFLHTTIKLCLKFYKCSHCVLYGNRKSPPSFKGLTC